MSPGQAGNTGCLLIIVVFLLLAGYASTGGPGSEETMLWALGVAFFGTIGWFFIGILVALVGPNGSKPKRYWCKDCKKYHDE